ncbi:MAG: ABC transporter ATP-binding protein [Gammaproteobacteria bacterium]|nr:ABC transporter ATP-binding protein [Gammaproteobacteria bacterium]
MINSIIECREVSHFYGSLPALSNVSFELEAGDPVGLVGPNGAGKTTLLNLICGFLLPGKGQISVFGQSPGAAGLIGRIGALPQDSRFDPNFSIGQQLVLYGRLQGLNAGIAEQEAQRVMDAVDLGNMIDQKPISLSHGMVKRVLIAQALIGTPDLVILDEPSAGLDPMNTRTIRHVIQQQSTQSTFIISSHNLDELGKLCSRVLLLDKGRMTPHQIHQGDAVENASQRYLTLVLESYPENDVIQRLQEINGIARVSVTQKNEYLIEYDALVEPAMDLKVMTNLSENQWNYKQLLKGKSLEEQLFASHNADR